MKALVIGTTGSYVWRVLPALRARGVTVRALVRDKARETLARQRGAQETVIGDLTQPESLIRAADGVEGVFHTNPAFAPHEAELGVAMVKAATQANVRKFVFSSVYHPSIATMVNHRDKQPVEQALYESDLDFTILQPAMFMQNLDGALEAAREHGQLVMPYSVHARTSWVDYRDVAEVAARAMTDDALSYGTFELSSPGMIDRVQMAALISDVTGRPVKAGAIPREAWAQQFSPGTSKDGLVRMMEHYDRYGFHGGNGLVLEAILGREPRTLQDYFKELEEAATHG